MHDQKNIFLRTMASGLLLASTLAAEENLHLPFKEAGLSEKEAAAHLLERFAFGARPGEVDRVVEKGLEIWILEQLAGDLPDARVERRLRRFKSLTMTTREIALAYPGPGLVLAEARRQGALDEVDLEQAQMEREDKESRGRGMRRGDPATRQKVYAFAREQGYRPQRELLGEHMMRKLYRAVESENQLSEVLTDFWFNHFNVSLTDTDARLFVPTYERDAIRPHVLGNFRDMLEATARHPAMLLYLDNARSVADEGAEVTFDPDRARERFARGGRRGRSGERRERWRDRGTGAAPAMDPERRERLAANRPRGLNENYARELLELHTLGVDGGYSQKDVIEVARAFTGWTTLPPGPRRKEFEERIERAQNRMARFGARQTGFVFEEDFLFRADAHDAGAKTVLGRSLPPGRGIEDGLEVLDLVASHPATARHLATKLAVRFVADTPPKTLVDRLALTFRRSGGDLREMMVTLVESPEFWSDTARRKKIKSPFELAVSALRITGAGIVDPRELIDWISRMGQPLYAYQAPTGYPDRADFWVNSGSLLTRMNFGLQLATGRVSGVRLDLPTLYGGGEPESLDAALRAYVPLLLPERDPGPTVDRLTPVIRDPELARKIEEASPTTEALDYGFGEWDELVDRGRSRRVARPAPRFVDASPLAQVVGVILGSPEFQRR